MSASTLTIGIDVGGTFIKAGLVSGDGALVERREIETQADGGFEHVLGRIADVAADLAQAADPRGLAGSGRATAIGLGVPGPMSHVEGIVHRAPNLAGWENVPVRDRLARRAGLPVTLENDANAAAFGEFVAGAGRSARSLVLMTLGTGIGGGVVLDGRLWRGDFDSAGEIGHMLVAIDGRECPCGQRGCLERYASANAVAERYAEAMPDAAPTAAPPPAELSARHVAQRAARGDPVAARVWNEMAQYLALACVNIQHLFSPELVLLAGGLIQAGDQLLDPVRRHFDRLSWRIAPDRPRIELATLGGNAGVIGAAALARGLA